MAFGARQASHRGARCVNYLDGIGGAPLAPEPARGKAGQTNQAALSPSYTPMRRTLPIQPPCG